MHGRKQESAPTSDLRKEDIEREVRRLAPFHHDIDLPFGLRTYLPDVSRQERERTRLATLVDHVWPSLMAECGGSLKGLRVLDVACNCGGFSVHAARSGADYVLGFDVDEHYLSQAEFIKSALGLANVQFQKLHLEDLDPEIHGRFDVVLCLGILYHLENPVLCMQKLAAVTEKLIVVDTTLLRIPYINFLLRRLPLWHMRVVPAVTDVAQNISTSRWRKHEHGQFSPNAAAVEELLKYSGFEDIQQLRPKNSNPELRYHNGTRATFIARKRND